MGLFLLPRRHKDTKSRTLVLVPWCLDSETNCMITIFVSSCLRGETNFTITTFVSSCLRGETNFTITTFVSSCLRGLILTAFVFQIHFAQAQDTILLYGDTIRVGSLEWDMQKDWRAKGTRITENRELYGDHVRILLHYHSNRTVSEIVFGYIDKKEGFVSHGPARYFFDTGQLLSKRTFIQGKMQGRTDDFYRDGKFRARAFVVDGRLNGGYESYYPDGGLELACYYFLDSLDGTYRTFYSNHQPHKIAHWSRDKRIGVDSSFYENGKLESIVPFEYDQQHGIAKVFHRNGRQWTEMVYQKGRLVEVAFSQSKEGNPLDVGGFQNGLGWVNIYNENGILIERDFYKEGLRRKTRKARE
jgi:antitoxin component YwqK of YwqJK toxin-antitoxin module